MPQEAEDDLVEAFGLFPLRPMAATAQQHEVGIGHSKEGLHAGRGIHFVLQPPQEQGAM